MGTCAQRVCVVCVLMKTDRRIIMPGVPNVSSSVYLAQVNARVGTVTILIGSRAHCAEAPQNKLYVVGRVW